MEKYLLNKIKNMSGKMLGIGIGSEKIKEAIEKNNNILDCYLMDESSSKFNKKKLKFNQKVKTVNIKKIKKIFKKKRIDNIICNYDTVKPFLKTFVRDSVYINKGKLYIYGNGDIDILLERYKRYTDDIEIKQVKDGFIIVIDNTSTSNSKLKDIIYWWSDTLNNALDILTQILVN